MFPRSPVGAWRREKLILQSPSRLQGGLSKRWTVRTQRSCDHISIGEPHSLLWSDPTSREGYSLQGCGLRRAFDTRPHALLREVDTQSSGVGERGPLVTVCLVKCPVLGSGHMGQHMWLWLGNGQRRYPDSISSGEKKRCREQQGTLAVV